MSIFENNDEEKQIETKSQELEEIYTKNAKTTEKNIFAINVRFETSEHYLDKKCQQAFIVKAVYEENEKIENILNTIIKYIENKSIVLNVKVKIKNVMKESFLKPQLYWWESEESWDDYLNSIGNNPITHYKKEDVIKHGLKVQVKQQHIELYTKLGKERKEIIDKLPKLQEPNNTNNWYEYMDYQHRMSNQSEERNKLVKIKVDTTGRFCAQFTIHASYEENEKIKNIFQEIIKYMEEAHYPIKIKINGQHCNGFADGSIKGALDFDSYIRWMGEASITDYKRYIISEKGLDLALQSHYRHKVISEELTCEHLKKLKSNDPLKCPIYAAIKQQYDFNKENLKHLNEYTHFTNEYEQKPACHYKDECKAYIRCENGENRLDDACHMKIYRHPPRRRQIELAKNLHPFVVNRKEDDNHGVYWPTDDDKKKYSYNEDNGYLQALIEEVISNGFKYDLCLQCNKNDKCNHDDYSLLIIVDEKMECFRHKSMDSPLNRAQMLALILYTGCESNYDLCGSQRKGDYAKWKWFDYCLYHAIEALSHRETGEFEVFSGLNGVKLDAKSVTNGWFVTYVSSSWEKDVAEGFMKNGSSDQGMIIQIDKEYKSGIATYHCPGEIRCCDVSWISKFEDECEILFARCTGNDVFTLNVVDDSTGIQKVSLQRKETFHGWTMDGATYM